MPSRYQRQIIKHTREKVRVLFQKHPSKGHDFAHTKRVRGWAVKIARGEKADMFLCEMSAWLHDIGRVKEKVVSTDRSHHEWSYAMCREWFRNDKILSSLSRPQKLAVLYAVRYHWNNAADKYKIASILRDADKLDLFGKTGVRRLIKTFGDNDDRLGMALRLSGDCLLWLKTKTAKRILRENKMAQPFFAYCKKYLEKKTKPVRL